MHGHDPSTREPRLPIHGPERSTHGREQSTHRQEPSMHGREQSMRGQEQSMPRQELSRSRQELSMRPLLRPRKGPPPRNRRRGCDKRVGTVSPNAPGTSGGRGTPAAPHSDNSRKVQAAGERRLTGGHRVRVLVPHPAPPPPVERIGLDEGWRSSCSTRLPVRSSPDG
jgi:hypothetical protein